MKNIFVLLICWLIVFKTLGATFKAKTTASVAGGFITSLIKYDGSLEEGVANFSSTAGVISHEANGTMQGNFRGSWVVSTSATLDGVAQAITATNTYEISWQIESSDPANTWVCGYTTQEDNCRKIGAKTGQQKVLWSAPLNTGATIKPRIKYTGTSATIKFDDVKIGPQDTLYLYSANVAASGAVTNATQSFVTSCTNATPSVCSLWTGFGVAPICWTHTVDITKRAEVTASTATTVTVARTDTSTAFNLFCHLK